MNHIAKTLGLSFLVGIICVPPMVYAQGLPFRPDQAIEGQLIEIPREVERLVSEAKESIERKAWSEATMAIGILLGIEKENPSTEFGSQDYFATPIAKRMAS